MKLILITSPTPHPHEIEILNIACDLGVNRIHIRKPNTEEKALEIYLANLKADIIKISALHYYENLVQKYLIPVFHLPNNIRKKILDEYNNITKKYNFALSTSFHHPNEIISEGKGFDHAFCSPVFPSISKKGHIPSLDWDLNTYNLHTINRPELIALGGIDSGKVADCKNRGFAGVAVLGSIWNQSTKEESINELKKIKAECDRLP